jgi:hypothetical protein
MRVPVYVVCVCIYAFLEGQELTCLCDEYVCVCEHTFLGREELTSICTYACTYVCTGTGTYIRVCSFGEDKS